jgi:hypothetical protein
VADLYAKYQEISAEIQIVVESVINWNMFHFQMKLSWEIKTLKCSWNNDWLKWWIWNYLKLFGIETKMIDMMRNRISQSFEYLVEYELIEVMNLNNQK